MRTLTSNKYMMIFEKCLEEEGKKKGIGAPRRPRPVPRRWLCYWLLELQGGEHPGGQVTASRRPLGGKKRWNLTHLLHSPPTLSLSSTSLILLLPLMKPINLSSILLISITKFILSYHPHHLRMGSLFWSSLSPLSSERNKGGRRPTSPLMLLFLPPLPKVIFDL